MESFVPNCQTSLNERGDLKKPKNCSHARKRVRQFFLRRTGCYSDAGLHTCQSNLSMVAFRWQRCRMISPLRQSVALIPLYPGCPKFANGRGDTIFQKSLDTAVETAPTSTRSLPSQANQPTQVGFALLLQRFQSPGATFEKLWRGKTQR